MSTSSRYSHEAVISMLKSPEVAVQSSALEFIYRTYRPRIYNNLRKKGASKEDFEDCFQEALIQTIKKLREGEQINNLGGYLRTIVFRQVFKRPTTTQDIELLDFVEFTVPTDVENTQLLEHVQKLWEQVDGKCWEIFELRYYLIPWGEIGETTNTNPATSKMRHKRCMEKFIAWLEKHPVLLEELYEVLGKKIKN